MQPADKQQPDKTTYTTLRLILGDQLNASHSWYQSKNDAVLYVIAELQQETNYVVHHVQKICSFFAAMTQFADALKQAGHQVLHLTLDDTESYQSLPELLSSLFQQYQVSQFEYQLPDEHRLRVQLEQFSQLQTLTCQAVETEHFYLTDEQLSSYFKPNTSHRLEHFYRKMRVSFDVLMDGDQSMAGQWNFDKDNRNKLKASDVAQIPEALIFDNDVSDILLRLDKHKVRAIGQPAKNLLWPVNRKQALQLLEYFCQVCLPNFGRFQDAMTGKLKDQLEDKGWSLYHSRLSFVLNSKILSPTQVVNRVIEHYQAHTDSIDMAQVEGFVRQILGWREFVRGIYWANVPNYRSLNHLKADRELPSWFWSGNCKMACVRHAIGQSLEFAYAHHIQRLMITGNFCLLTGIHPDQVDAWYLGIYVDALEWVEMPNTRGMSQFADGGIVGSKPYAASGNYVNKMSDYCKDCQYDVKQTVGSSACPLNSLYWRFMDKHQTMLSNNPRNAMVYKNWLKKSELERSQVLQQAERYLIEIESL